jgi:hypothetical protein
MQTSSRRDFLIAWLIMSSLAIGVCSLVWPAAHLGSEYMPVSNDSFYHARRIMDAVHDPDSFYEFDTKIHVPEGSLLPWPWGYDYVMAKLVRAGMAMGFANDPLGILVWLPVAAVPLSMLMIMLIARRLSLSLWSSTLAGLCVALSPLTQYLHGVGFIDHHFAEYMFVLAAVAMGLRWFVDLANQRAAAVLGVVLGLAPAVHNALFILQVPVVAALLMLWLQAVQPTRRAMAHFTIALLGSSLAILLPSLPFQQGRFEFFLLSWFQLYVAVGTAICCGLFTWWRVSRPSIAALAVFAVAALVPLGYQIAMAESFLTGKILRLDGIGEMFSVPRLIRNYGALDTANRYSQLLWLVPATIGYCLFKVWQQRRDGQLFFWLSATLGLLLLLLQFRLHYYGSFALCIPWLVFAENLASRTGPQARMVMLSVTAGIVLAYVPTLRYQLLGPIPLGNDLYLANLRPALRTLAKACKEDPGVVLADHDAGHYIRFFTNCSVIANNFLLTPQHAQKVLEMERLFKLPAQELLNQAAYVKYVLVRPLSVQLSDSGVVYVSYSTAQSDLVVDLLLKPGAPEPQPPPAQYRLLDEATLLHGANRVPYVRLYKIESDAHGGEALHRE